MVHQATVNLTVCNIGSTGIKNSGNIAVYLGMSDTYTSRNVYYAPGTTLTILVVGVYLTIPDFYLSFILV